MPSSSVRDIEDALSQCKSEYRLRDPLLREYFLWLSSELGPQYCLLPYKLVHNLYWSSLYPLGTLHRQPISEARSERWIEDLK